MSFFFSFYQLDSKAQGELKEGMKIYDLEPGLKNSWDNLQKMVNLLPKQAREILYIVAARSCLVQFQFFLTSKTSSSKTLVNIRVIQDIACWNYIFFFFQFKCCGVTNKTDWYEALNGSLPSSCCSIETDQCINGWSEVSLRLVSGKLLILSLSLSLYVCLIYVCMD